MLDLTNNLGHLCQESVRHLCTVRPFTMETMSGYNDSARDLGSSDGGGPTERGRIRWTRNTARRWGPFFVSADEGEHAASAMLRKVRVAIELTVPAGVTSARGIFVLTKGSSAEEILSRRELAAVERSWPSAGGYITERVLLEPTAVVDASYRADRAVPCSPTGATMNMLRVFYVWVGLSVIDPSAPRQIFVHSISVYEARG
jgi:hypothetical protein